MILSRLDLKAFGRFTDVSLDLSAGPRRFHLVYGPNESGKTTSLRAITSLLFGIPQTSDDCFVHRKDRVRVGGLLVDPASGVSLECIRRRGRKATLRDAHDDEPIDETSLESMLGGINRETFLTRFGLSYEALVQGGTAILQGGGDLGQILFAAGAGVGRLREIQTELDEAAGALFAPRGKKASINAALKSLEEDRLQLRDVQVPAAEFARLRDQFEAKQREAESLDQALRQCVVSLAQLQAFEQALPLLPTWRTTREALSRLKDVPALDEDFTERRRQVSADQQLAISRQKELEVRIAELTAKLESIGCDPAVMSYEAAIQELFEQVSARKHADRQRRELLTRRQQLDDRIGDLLRHLEVDVESCESADSAEAVQKAVERLRVSDPVRSRIQQLAASHAGLIARRNEASDHLETAKKRLADVSQELETLGDVGDPQVLASVMESMGNPESDLNSLLETRQHCEALRRRCELMLKQLDGFEGDLDQAVQLKIPSDSMIRQLAETLRCALHDVNHQESRLNELQQQRADVHRQLAEAEAAHRLPTLSELDQARQSRDQAVEHLAGTIRAGEGLSDSLDRLRELILQADRLADTMRDHSEQVHRRETLASELALLDHKIRESKQALASKHESFVSAKANWMEVWEASRIKAGQPEEMQQWLANHGKLCEWMNQLEIEEGRLDQIQFRINRATRRLRAVLDSVDSGKPVRAGSAFQSELFNDSSDDDLLSLYDEAVARRSEWTRDRQQYESLRRRHDELSEELPRAETRLEAAQEAVVKWHADWRRVTESFVQSDVVDTQGVLRMLDQLSELDKIRRDREAASAQLTSIERDDQAYRERVFHVAKAIDHVTDEQGLPTEVAQSIYQRLQAERTAAQGRETLEEQIESANERISETLAQLNECELLLKQLCAEAGCESPEQLPELERRSKERCRLEATLSDTESQLRRLAGQLGLDEFIEQASGQQEAVLAVDIEREKTRQAELKQQLERVHREVGAAQSELQRIDGGSRASDLAQSMQMSVGAIRSDVEDYARLKIGALILRRAIEHYRRANQSPVLALADAYFRQLTCGEYQELKPDYDSSGNSMLFGVNAAGDPVPVSAMSTGTADALYLALRLASLDHQFSRGRAIPVVIDDCLIQLDDARAAAALRAFSDLSEKTQVVLFTHHQHLCQLARERLEEGDYHLHQLTA